MNKKIIAGCVFLSLLIIQPSYAKEPKNLDLVKASLIKYNDSGAYKKDFSVVIDKAMEYLKTRLATEKQHPNKNKKLAIVLDIDETSLSNYPDMLRMSFGGTDEQIIEAENKGMDAAMAATLELYRYAKANHVAVFFITGRTEDAREPTERNLKNVGFVDSEGVTLKPVDYKEKSPTPYKTSARSRIENQGYDIVLNIGDQQSDLAGGHADKTFKLPNPYYFIP